jgi:hypothetical protein
VPSQNETKIVPVVHLKKKHKENYINRENADKYNNKGIIK